MEGETIPISAETRLDVPEDNPKGDAPPPYSSVMAQMQKANAESNNKFEYAWKVFGMIFCGTVCGIIQIVFCLAIPVACIVIGAMNLKNCTIEKYIPIYLVVAGVFGVVKAIASSICACVNRKKNNEYQPGEAEEIEKPKPNPVDSLLNCFLMAWFIAGSVWVYRIYGEVNYDVTTADDYCDKTTYLFTFWLITAGYICMALGIFCCCGICCCMMCVAAKS